MSAPDAAGLAQVAREHCVSLLKRFLSGLMLAPVEMAALCEVLPPDVLGNPPDPEPDYLHPYSYYAAALKCGERNIKRLVAAGRPAIRGAPADFPPFDAPAKILLWWSRRMGRDPGPHVLAFARASGATVAADDPSTAHSHPSSAATPTPGATPPPPKSSASSASTLPPPLPPSALPFHFEGIGGFEGSVRELRVTVAAAQHRLRQAMLANPLDESLVASCNRTVREQLDLLRKSENDLFDFQQKRGELVPKSEIREDWRALLSAMRRMRERMEANVESALAKTSLFTAEQLALVKAAVGAERGREDQLLRTSKFWRRDSHVSPEPIAVS